MPAKPLPEFLQFLAEQLQPLGLLRCKRMFGGWGLYLDGLFCAIVVDEVLYLKTDPLTVANFIAAGSVPFEYQRGDGRLVRLQYHRLPDHVCDGGPELQQWLRLAMSAALRAQSSV